MVHGVLVVAREEERNQVADGACVCVESRRQRAIGRVRIGIGGRGCTESGEGGESEAIGEALAREGRSTWVRGDRDRCVEFMQEGAATSFVLPCHQRREGSCDSRRR